MSDNRVILCAALIALLVVGVVVYNVRSRAANDFTSEPKRTCTHHTSGMFWIDGILTDEEMDECRRTGCCPLCGIVVLYGLDEPNDALERFDTRVRKLEEK